MADCGGTSDTGGAVCNGGEPMNADENCKGCKYLVDWHDMPKSTGYSMATQTGDWYGCMRAVATINHPNEEHVCRKFESRERQLVLL